MNNFLLSMIICLDKNSLPIKYYEQTLKEFTDGFGYHLQIDGKPFEYGSIEEFFKICNDYGITGIGVRTSEKVTSKDIDMIKLYNLRSIMYRYGDECLESNIVVAQNNGIKVEMSVILSKENINKIDEIIDWSIEKKINLLVLERSIIAKYRHKYIEPLEKEQYKSLMEKILKHNHNSNNIDIALSHCPNKILLHKEREYTQEIGGCSAGIISCALDTNGNIIPCLPLYKIVLGNVKNNKITEVWSSSEICLKLRDRSNLKGKCAGCYYKNSCGGCRAEAFYRNEDLFDEDYTCWNET